MESENTSITPENESILKPKAKRNLTDEQRLVLSQRMKLVNEKRLASKRQQSTDAVNKVESEANVKATLPPPVETPKPQKKKRVVKFAFEVK